MMDGFPNLSRVQVEAAALAVGILALLWLYRSYLERSLAVQAEYLGELVDQRDREQAATNGSLDPEHVATWLREHPEQYGEIVGMMGNMAAGDPPVPPAEGGGGA